jgi:replicative DNA helicase
MLIDAIGKENLAAVGGVTYLSELAMSGIPLNPKAYINMLKDKAYRRKAIKAMIEGIDKMQNEKENSNQVAGELTNILTSTIDNKTSIMSESKLFSATLEEIEKRYQTGGKIPGMRTGFTDFDRATNGLKKGELFVLGGRPSMGKTLMALNIADGLGEDGYKGLIIELEMTPESLGMRRLAYNSNIEAQKLQTGKLTDKEFEKIVQIFSHLSAKNNIFTDCSSYQSILTIKAKAKAMKQSNGLDFLVIDHLTLMDIKDRGNRSQDIGEVTRQLKLLAKELDINVILLCQLSRKLEERADKRPMKRETELLIKGATIEITKVLSDFDEIMNAKLGDEVWNSDSRGNEILGTRRKSTLQDTIDFMQSEWSNTSQKLSKLGIEIEAGSYLELIGK